MRIAYITFEYPPIIIGGASIHATHITQELAFRGHTVVIFTQATENSTLEENIAPNLKVVRVPLIQILPFKAFQFWILLPKKLKKIDKNEKFDIIHFNGLSYGFFKKKITNSPHIITIHHLVTDAIANNNENIFCRILNIKGETGFFLPFIEKRCINSVDKIIAVSQYTRNRIIQTYNVDPLKIDVIYNGIDSTGYSFTQADINATKLKYNIKDTPIILFVGRINDRRKGLDILIDAFKLVIEKIDAQLLVVGSGMQEQIRNLSRPLGDKVIFIGYVDEITLKKIYALCDLYVCPSRLEGFGLTIIEAFAAGKPVVATRVGAIPELVSSGNNGILVDPENAQKMASEILNLINDRELTNKIIQYNIEQKTIYSWERSALLIENFYNKTKG